MVRMARRVTGWSAKAGALATVCVALAAGCTAHSAPPPPRSRTHVEVSLGRVALTGEERHYLDVFGDNHEVIRVHTMAVVDLDDQSLEPGFRPTRRWRQQVNAHLRAIQQAVRRISDIPPPPTWLRPLDKAMRETMGTVEKFVAAQRTLLAHFDGPHGAAVRAALSRMDLEIRKEVHVLHQVGL